MDYLGKKCPICSARFHAEDDIVVCPECGAPYHRTCYQNHGKCIFDELHAQGKTWRDSEEEQPETEGTILCPYCNTSNSSKNLLCTNCGKLLHIKEATDSDGNQVNNGAATGGAVFGGNMGMPFAAVYDSMAGVSPEEDFDGVSAAEIAKSVKVNTPYYMSVFKSAKNTGYFRFNFGAFFFCGGWLLYRKQYIKGGIVTVLMALFMLAENFIYYFYSSAIWSSIAQNLEAAGTQYANITTYFTELFKLSTGEIILGLSPYICDIALLVLSIILGFTANKCYYKFTLNKIKKLKQDKTGDELMQALDETGGVNHAVVYMLLVCAFIIQMIPLLFL